MKLDLTMPAFEPLATAPIIDDDDDIIYVLRLQPMRDESSVHAATNGRPLQYAAALPLARV